MQQVQEQMVQVTGLRKMFGHRVVLHEVNFAITTGEVVGLVGPNGAGKTTIMKALLGLLATDAGNVRILGQPVSVNTHTVVTQQVGALIEHPAIYPFLSGWQHLQLMTASVEQMTWVVQALQMQAFIRRPAKRYSLGMKQKLGIAMALVKRPRLVILDEPMNGLDPQSVKRLRHLIGQMAGEGTSFLISSHILSELEKIIDAVILIDQGEVLLQRTMGQFRESARQSLVVRTAENARALRVLLQADYPVIQRGSNLIVTQPVSLTPLLHTLLDAHIQILKVNQHQEDLETVLLRLLAERKV
ncbi:ABC transporter-like protein [Levilactobacillus senmaizukei DSM 21775 = NBRC 103853]|uniref:ABC transporter-like protein n=1 Tax=Levilactobacillus senmaizukei DSM 21775 = NBRC 103853 TaxID=1423803 RepID=A0A0R2DDM7_9LACO|nr:ABC transporter ATP-binding protein [Levilactobacillus senmaizukei]KRN01003.1 ABC transporter-like protein [Levilactobacillus senmaizukei DSM 21775 = NBRC 103853]